MRGVFDLFVRPFGYRVVRSRQKIDPDICSDDDFMRIHKVCDPFTMTSIERMYGLYKAVRYVVDKDIPGDIVECGVWMGGSAMMAAMTLELVGDTSRELYLYDTFEGMPPPSDQDINHEGVHANAFLKPESRVDGESNVWAYASLEMVRGNLSKVGLPSDRFHLIKGGVEETIPDQSPEAISLLRLDTDWYESTAHELKYMYPVLSMGGVLIIDDYGHWRGSREATDEYFSSNSSILLNRLDYSGRISIKL
ncbi:MAG: macrocin O-methyltransferase [Pelagibacteraceae bacterium]|nr:macrocin O-methyltransferase [Pelagibacteraceae bacterium]PPR09985.1 MAG: 8-demethyl-8-(2,3-dimethoxy-alpha-L-rhamnosyl)-tetracenomycin-C 4'-O-methyltransferase [Alphaproteobacteria bacterium MarineAlpha11_Bin1]|tara:strand:- start:18428 stop:19180 length:753 start_codon:yes stop_codon:yes gene_type:complete